MGYTEQLKIIGGLILLLLGILLFLSWKRPTVENFQVSAEVANMETKANEDSILADRLREEADRAVETCQVLGIQLPGITRDSESLYTFTLSRQCPPELKLPSIRKLMQNLLKSQTPLNLSSSNAEEIEKSKMTIAKALAAEAQAFASSSMSQAVKDRIAATNILDKEVPLKEEIKNNTTVKQAQANAEEKKKEAEKLAAEAAIQNQQANTAAADTSKNPEEIAKAQKDADEAIAKAAAAVVEAAKAEKAIVETIATVDKSKETQEAVKVALEAEEKAIKAAEAAVEAAQIKAEVSQTQLDLEKAKAAGQDTLAVEEELRRKRNESEIAAAEVMRQQAEQRRLEQESQERRLYATDILNGLLQSGIIQSNDETYNKILNGKSKDEIDKIAKDKTQEVKDRKIREAQEADRFNRRLNELNEARQNRAILSREEELSILNLPSEGDFQIRKAEVKARVDEMIKKEKQELQEKIDKINAEAAAKEKQRLDELVAMSASQRALAQQEEAKKKEAEIQQKSTKAFEDYKDRILRRLVSVERILSQDVATRLKNLGSYGEFDTEVKKERMKTENAQQRAQRETEEASFDEYKRTEINNLLKEDLISSDQTTLARFRNTTNLDQLNEIMSLEIAKQRQKIFAERAADASSAQSKALFAQNMEPVRTQLVEAAYKDGALDKEQYERLKVTSINTQEKYAAVESEVKKARMALRDRLEAETQRKIEEETKAKEEEERKKREEEEKAIQKVFVKMRNDEVPDLMRGMFPITEAQKEELLSINDRVEYQKKKEAFLLQAYGGTRNPGESLADFFNRRRDERIAELADAERKERIAKEEKGRIDAILSGIQGNLNSNNRFWQADAQRDMKKVEELRARNLSNADFLKEWQEYQKKIYEDAVAEEKRKAEEKKRKETLYATLNLDNQRNVLVVKDENNLEVKYFRIPSKRMGFTSGMLYNKTAEECLNEYVKDPTFFGFDRKGHSDDDRGECGKLTTKMPYFWSVQNADKERSMFVRQDYVSKVPGVDQSILTEANQAAAAYASKKEDIELEKKLTPEAINQLLSESKIINISGTDYRVFPNSAFPDSTHMEAKTHWAGIAQAEPRLTDAHNDLVRHGAKSFVRTTRGGLEGERGRGANQQETTFLSNEANAFKLSKTLWRATNGYATFIPVANLPEKLRVSGFTDYSNVYNQRARSLPPTANTRYITNQNNYMQRTSRTNDYTFFHPAL